MTAKETKKKSNKRDLGLAGKNWECERNTLKEERESEERVRRRMGMKKGCVWWWEGRKETEGQ